MPTSIAYPPGPANLTGDVLTISRFLADPKWVQRELRKVTDKQFVGDRILKGRVTAEGGMVAYETNESIYPLGVPSDIAPGGEFPLVNTGDGDAVLETVGKFGYRSRIMLESVKRRKGEPVVKARTKLANGIIQSFDGRVMAKVAAAVPSMNSITAGGLWAGGTGKDILRDLLVAQATLKDLREGYNPDTLLLDNMQWAILSSDKDLQNAMHRETVDTPFYTGEVLRIAGLEILGAPTGNPLTAPIVYDSTQLGSIVQETFNEPGATTDTQGVISEVAYHGAADEAPDGAEFWTMSGKRQAIGIIQEPKSAVVITGTK